MRIAAGVTILAAHAVALFLSQRPTHVHYRSEDFSAFTATMIDSGKTQTHYVITVPPISSFRVRLEMLPAPIVKMDVSSDGVAAHFEPATIDITRPIKPFSADWSADHQTRSSVTITLLIEVRPDGSVGEIEVKAGSGDPEMDAAAVAYVGKLRWKPALREGSATAMKILYSLTS